MMCIWCKKVRQPAAVEHIIPDALGCPPGFIFSNGEVCKRCNNRLSTLDHAVVSDFEMCKLWHGVRSKRGRSPSLSTRGNALGRHVAKDHIELLVNMEHHSVRTGDGRTIGAFKGTPNNLTITVKDHGNGWASGTILQHGFCESTRAVRGLHKIALEVLAHYQGVEETCRDFYDPVRLFVCKGRGTRIVLRCPGEDNGYVPQVLPPSSSPTERCVIAFQFFGMRFLVDLSPDQHHLGVLRTDCRAKYGDNWNWTPANATW